VTNSYAEPRSIATFVLLLLSLACLPAAAEAQAPSRGDIAGGYQLTNHSFAGWFLSGSAAVGRSRFSIVGEANAVHGAERIICLGIFGCSSDSVTISRFMAGLRFGARQGTVRPYVQYLAGAGLLDGVGDFGDQTGGGIDVMLSDRAALRIGVDYQGTVYDDHVFRLAAGLVRKF